MCLDLSKMNKILAVNAEDFDATVECGVTRVTLNNYLRDTGLHFPIGKNCSRHFYLFFCYYFFLLFRILEKIRLDILPSITFSKKKKKKKLECRRPQVCF